MKRMMRRRQEVVGVGEEVVVGAGEVEGESDGVDEDGLVLSFEVDKGSIEMIIVVLQLK